MGQTGEFAASSLFFDCHLTILTEEVIYNQQNMLLHVLLLRKR